MTRTSSSQKSTSRRKSSVKEGKTQIRLKPHSEDREKFVKTGRSVINITGNIYRKLEDINWINQDDKLDELETQIERDIKVAKKPMKTILQKMEKDLFNFRDLFMSIDIDRNHLYNAQLSLMDRLNELRDIPETKKEYDKIKSFLIQNVNKLETSLINNPALLNKFYNLIPKLIYYEKYTKMPTSSISKKSLQEFQKAILPVIKKKISSEVLAGINLDVFFRDLKKEPTLFSEKGRKLLAQFPETGTKEYFMKHYDDLIWEVGNDLYNSDIWELAGKTSEKDLDEKELLWIYPIMKKNVSKTNPHSNILYRDFWDFTAYIERGYFKKTLPFLP